MAIPTLPPAPARTDAPAVFVPKADAWVAALPPWTDAANALQVDVSNNQVIASAAAATATTQAANASASAAAAASAANATVWVSGTTYAFGVTVISPANAQPYRRKIAGAGTTDPSLDSVNWTSATNLTGLGGTAITGNVTLTAVSPASMTINPTSPGLYATLPDATTMVKSVSPFSFNNAGDYDYGIKDSTGKQLGWIRPGTGSIIGVSDISTAAGVWTGYGLERLGTTALYTNLSVTDAGFTIRRISIDSNRTCFLFGGNTLYAIIYDASTFSWGNPVLIRSGITSASASGIGFAGVLSGANQILVCSTDTAVGTAFQAVTLTLSGSVITVNSAVNSTLGSAINFFGPLIAVSTSFVVGYVRGSATCIRAFTIAGTVPTIGAETTLSGNGVVPNLFASGSIVRTVSQVPGNGMLAIPYTVSGTTLTSGTSATGGSAAFCRAFLNGNGNIVAQTIGQISIFKLTGTVEAVSTVTYAPTVQGTISTTECLQVGTNKVALFWSSTTNVYCNVVTDTTGTASAGTQVIITTPTASSVSSVFALTTNGTTAKFAYGLTGQMVSQLSFNCSGASPVLSGTFQAFTGQFSTPAVSDIFGVRSPAIIGSGSNCTLTSSTLSTTSTAYDINFKDNGIVRKVPIVLNALPVPNSGNISGTVVSPTISVFSGYGFTTPSQGATIQQIEAAT